MCSVAVHVNNDELNSQFARHRTLTLIRENTRNMLDVNFPRTAVDFLFWSILPCTSYLKSPPTRQVEHVPAIHTIIGSLPGICPRYGTNHALLYCEIKGWATLSLRISATGPMVV